MATEAGVLVWLIRLTCLLVYKHPLRRTLSPNNQCDWLRQLFSNPAILQNPVHVATLAALFFGYCLELQVSITAVLWGDVQPFCFKGGGITLIY